MRIKKWREKEVRIKKWREKEEVGDVRNCLRFTL